MQPSCSTRELPRNNHQLRVGNVHSYLSAIAVVCVASASDVDNGDAPMGQ